MESSANFDPVRHQQSSLATAVNLSSAREGGGPESNLSDIILRDDFDQNSCLRNSALSSMLNNQGELILNMSGGAGQRLATVTELGYGRYMARIKTNVGAGSVIAFYIMGVDSTLRNNLAFYYLHDEVDFELVNTLWREGQQIADNATWINAYHHHTSIILPLYNGDSAGGSLFTLATKKTQDDTLFNRLFGHNFSYQPYAGFVLISNRFGDQKR